MTVDRVRGFSFYAETPGTYPIELSDCALVQSITLTAGGEGGEEDVVVLQLQDSQIRVASVAYHADLATPLRWPAYARLTIPSGRSAWIHLTYQDCT